MIVYYFPFVWLYSIFLFVWLFTISYLYGCMPFPFRMVVYYSLFVWLFTVLYSYGCLPSSALHFAAGHTFPFANFRSSEPPSPAPLCWKWFLRSIAALEGSHKYLKRDAATKRDDLGSLLIEDRIPLRDSLRPRRSHYKSIRNSSMNYASRTDVPDCTGNKWSVHL